MCINRFITEFHFDRHPNDDTKWLIPEVQFLHGILFLRKNYAAGRRVQDNINVNCSSSFPKFSVVISTRFQLEILMDNSCYS